MTGRAVPIDVCNQEHVLERRVEVLVHCSHTNSRADRQVIIIKDTIMNQNFQSRTGLSETTAMVTSDLSAVALLGATTEDASDEAIRNKQGNGANVVSFTFLSILCRVVMGSDHPDPEERALVSAQIEAI